ncbi:hypothetical protein GGX14DRAFT_671569 [Mycena pura]|uniref:Chromodomain-helicase-DNA-binding protein 1-like C-terminal domain-containing protein n=1 Tax=Mycena pura TaxID=153505 RepID=A0AAD6UXV0_9AGAR|nr:hypothetical protein GGX14DRAFT_671569 [Mycena pura]
MSSAPVTCIARTFTHPEQGPVQYNEYRGVRAPLADLGAPGDMYLDTKAPALYARCAAGWTAWPGPQRRSAPLAHPTYPDLFLWASTARLRVLWMPRDKMKKLLGSAAEALKQIMASEERRDSRGVKRRAGESVAGTGDGKKSKVLEASAIEAGASRAETGVSRPEPVNGKPNPVPPSAEPVTAEIILPAKPIKSLSPAVGAKVIAPPAAHNDPPKPATPLKVISTPVQPNARAANPGFNPWLSTPVQPKARAANPGSNPWRAKPPKPATPLKAISTPVQPKAQAANPGSNSWLRAKPPTLSAPPSAKRPAPEELEDNDSRKRQRTEKTSLIDKESVKRAMDSVKRELRQLRGNTTPSDSTEVLSRPLLVVGRHIEKTIIEKEASGGNREQWKQKLWNYASQYWPSWATGNIQNAFEKIVAKTGSAETSSDRGKGKALHQVSGSASTTKLLSHLTAKVKSKTALSEPSPDASGLDTPRAASTSLALLSPSPEIEMTLPAPPVNGAVTKAPARATSLLERPGVPSPVIVDLRTLVGRPKAKTPKPRPQAQTQVSSAHASLNAQRPWRALPARPSSNGAATVQKTGISGFFGKDKDKQPVRPTEHPNSSTQNGIHSPTIGQAIAAKKAAKKSLGTLLGWIPPVADPHSTAQGDDPPLSLSEMPKQVEDANKDTGGLSKLDRGNAGHTMQIKQELASDIAAAQLRTTSTGLDKEIIDLTLDDSEDEDEEKPDKESLGALPVVDPHLTAQGDDPPLSLSEMPKQVEDANKDTGGLGSKLDRGNAGHIMQIKHEPASDIAVEFAAQLPNTTSTDLDKEIIDLTLDDAEDEDSGTGALPASLTSSMLIPGGVATVVKTRTMDTDVGQMEQEQEQGFAPAKPAKAQRSDTSGSLTRKVNNLTLDDCGDDESVPAGDPSPMVADASENDTCLAAASSAKQRTLAQSSTVKERNVTEPCPPSPSATPTPSVDGDAGLVDPDECKNMLPNVQDVACDAPGSMSVCVRRLNKAQLDLLFPVCAPETTMFCTACMGLGAVYECSSQTPPAELSTHVEERHLHLFDTIFDQTKGMSPEQVYAWIAKW